MDGIDLALHRAAQWLSRTLDPLMAALQRLGALIRQQLDAVHVPYAWQGWIVGALWALLVFMVLRTLSGWLRVLAAVVVAVVLAKAYGVLPGA